MSDWRVVVFNVEGHNGIVSVIVGDVSSRAILLPETTSVWHPPSGSRLTISASRTPALGGG